MCFYLLYTRTRLFRSLTVKLLELYLQCIVLCVKTQIFIHKTMMTMIKKCLLQRFVDKLSEMSLFPSFSHGIFCCRATD